MAASIYLAYKLIERRSEGCIKLMSRALFNEILVESGSENERAVVDCSKAAYKIFEQANFQF